MNDDKWEKKAKEEITNIRRALRSKCTKLEYPDWNRTRYYQKEEEEDTERGDWKTHLIQFLEGNPNEINFMAYHFQLEDPNELININNLLDFYNFLVRKFYSEDDNVVFFSITMIHFITGLNNINIAPFTDPIFITKCISCFSHDEREIGVISALCIHNILIEYPDDIMEVLLTEDYVHKLLQLTVFNDLDPDQYLASQNVKSAYKTVFSSIYTFLRQKFPSEFIPQLWDVALGFIQIDYSLAIREGYGFLYMIAKSGFVTEISPEIYECMLNHSIEGPKVLETYYLFLRSYQDNGVLLERLFSDGLLDNIYSNIFDRRDEAGLSYQFLKAINYSPDQELIQEAMNVIATDDASYSTKMSALCYLSSRIQTLPNDTVQLLVKQNLISYYATMITTCEDEEIIYEYLQAIYQAMQKIGSNDRNIFTEDPQFLELKDMLRSLESNKSDNVETVLQQILQLIDC